MELNDAYILLIAINDAITIKGCHIKRYVLFKCDNYLVYSLGNEILSHLFQ